MTEIYTYASTPKGDFVRQYYPDWDLVGLLGDAAQTVLERADVSVEFRRIGSKNPDYRNREAYKVLSSTDEIEFRFVDWSEPREIVPGRFETVARRIEHHLGNQDLVIIIQSVASE